MAKKTKSTEYDKTAVVEEQIVPIIAQLKRICAFENIPFFVSFASANKNGETEYFNDGNMPGSIPVYLDNDNFRKYLLVLQGANVTILNDVEEDMQAYINNNFDVNAEDD